MCKGANALGILKEHEAELEVLDSLLAQRRWRRGRRGMWHNRRALIYMTHFPRDDMGIAELARQGVIDALCDDDTHIGTFPLLLFTIWLLNLMSVHRPMLTRRLTRLEKKLNIPLMDRHTSVAQLRKPEETTVEGFRIRDRGSSLHLDSTGRPVTPLQPAERPMQWTPQSLSSNKKPSVALKGADEVGLLTSSVFLRYLNVLQKNEPWKGKSIWRGRDGDEVTVETLALQHYEDMGYQGFVQHFHFRSLG